MLEFKKVTIYKFIKNKCDKKLNIKIKNMYNFSKVNIILEVNH